MARLLYWLGSAAYRRRLVVVLVWLVVLVGSAVGALTLAGTTSTTFSIPGQESTTALDKIKDQFGGGGATARVVLAPPAGQQVVTAENAARITELVGRLNGLDGVTSASNPLDPKAPVVNADRDLAYSTVTYRAQVGEVTDAQRAALTDVVDDARAGGWTAEVIGEAMQAPPHVGGVVIALAILALTYGSLVMAGMNLLTAAVGVGIGTLGITVATGFMELSSTTPMLAAMLGLAVGIDYALFIINRFRQELRRGRDVGDAIGTAVGTAGSAVVTAGLTVVIALAGLGRGRHPPAAQTGLGSLAVGQAEHLRSVRHRLLHLLRPGRHRPAASGGDRGSAVGGRGVLPDREERDRAGPLSGPRPPGLVPAHHTVHDRTGLPGDHS